MEAFGLAVITLPTIALDFSPKAGIKKNVNSLDSQCLITSVANDYGYNNVFFEVARVTKGNRKNE